MRVTYPLRNLRSHARLREEIAQHLPYFEYLRNFRRMSFRRNLLNVFDKLNAPQTQFIDRARCAAWLDSQRFEPDSISIRRYAGVSYSLNAVRRGE